MVAEMDERNVQFSPSVQVQGARDDRKRGRTPSFGVSLLRWRVDEARRSARLAWTEGIMAPGGTPEAEIAAVAALTTAHIWSTGAAIGSMCLGLMELR